MSKLLCPICWDFAYIFDKSNLLGCACTTGMEYLSGAEFGDPGLNDRIQFSMLLVAW